MSKAIKSGIFRAFNGSIGLIFPETKLNLVTERFVLKTENFG